MDSPIDAGPLHDGEAQYQPISVPLAKLGQPLAPVGADADVLLLAWILTLSRYGDISDIEFTWGQNKSHADTTTEDVEVAVSASDVPFQPDGSIRSLFETVGALRRQTVPDINDVCLGGETLFFTNSKDVRFRCVLLGKLSTRLLAFTNEELKPFEKPFAGLCLSSTQSNISPNLLDQLD